MSYSSSNVCFLVRTPRYPYILNCNIGYGPVATVAIQLKQTCHFLRENRMGILSSRQSPQVSDFEFKFDIPLSLFSLLQPYELCSRFVLEALLLNVDVLGYDLCTELAPKIILVVNCCSRGSLSWFSVNAKVEVDHVIYEESEEDDDEREKEVEEEEEEEENMVTLTRESKRVVEERILSMREMPLRLEEEGEMNLLTSEMGMLEVAEDDEEVEEKERLEEEGDDEWDWLRRLTLEVVENEEVEHMERLDEEGDHDWDLLRSLMERILEVPEDEEVEEMEREEEDGEWDSLGMPIERVLEEMFEEEDEDEWDPLRMVMERVLEVFTGTSEEDEDEEEDEDDLDLEEAMRESLELAHEKMDMGASTSAIEKLKNERKVDSVGVAGTCIVCLEELSSKVEVELVKMPCDHMFHESCICRWLEESNSCPVCRSQACQ